MEPLLAKVIGFTEDALRKELIEEMGIRKGDRILEVCIGTGSNVPYFKDRGVSLISGVDISEEMLNRCAEKFPDTYLFLACAEALPFKDNTFDRILTGGGSPHEKLMGKEDIKRLMGIEPKTKFKNIGRVGE